MRALFLFLLLVNLVVFAYQRGWLGELPAAGREPARLAQQIEPGKIRVLTEAELQRLRERNAGNGAASEHKESANACIELGDFPDDVAARARQRLDALDLGARLTAVPVSQPGWYMVYLPPLKSRADAERVADDLRAKGVRDLLVIDDATPLRNGISLGQFKDQDLALKHQASLERRGVKGVRVSARPSTASATRFQISAPDAALTQQLQALQKEFAASRLGPCTPG